MKGTIRVRVNKDGSTSYVCQVKLGRDPGTGKERVLTGTARSERAAQKLLHTLVTKAEDRSQHASDATVATVIEQWLATGGPAGEATRDKGLAPASIRNAHTIVRAALAQAVRWGWTPTNVAALARPPVVPKAVIPTPKPDAVPREPGGRRSIGNCPKVGLDSNVQVSYCFVTCVGLAASFHKGSVSACACGGQLGSGEHR